VPTVTYVGGPLSANGQCTYTRGFSLWVHAKPKIYLSDLGCGSRFWQGVASPLGIYAQGRRADGEGSREDRARECGAEKEGESGEKEVGENLCTTLFMWQNSTPDMICRKSTRASSSVTLPLQSGADAPTHRIWFPVVVGRRQMSDKAHGHVRGQKPLKP
jgi:hypothetical protein